MRIEYISNVACASLCLEKEREREQRGITVLEKRERTARRSEINKCSQCSSSFISLIVWNTKQGKLHLNVFFTIFYINVLHQGQTNKVEN